MAVNPASGHWLALGGVLILSPDTLLMRLSGMTGLEMLAWRGLLMGSVLLLFSMFSSRQAARSLATRAGVTVTLCYFTSFVLFTIAVAYAPVIMILIGVATMPLFASAFAYLLFGEPTPRSTWIAMAAVCIGVAISVLGRDNQQLEIAIVPLLGSLAGVAIAMCHGMSFVTIRHSPTLAVAPAIGLGAMLAGIAALLTPGTMDLFAGDIWAIAMTGVLILPVSFLMLSKASRSIGGAGVSLILLLETVLGPFWVWVGVGEQPTPEMILGCVVVLSSLALFLVFGRFRRSL